MLEIIKIKKDYVLKDQTVEALKGVTIRFRRSEFVSILGPSGCGKTTLLNIIGGLDKYSDGDLMIDGISTKEYKDKDWDNYRNHHIGFVFQTYNLIPHQTVLENVELALTLSGVSKTERRERATEVLHKVGLSDKLKSKPNQLSGGQMQRVAIARALVNDPKIILADEPTGALDSKISLQIMDLLKEVSKDRLVLMVTHNPELANTYSSRIITLLDGELTDDSKPYSEKELQTDYKKHAAKLETEKMALENQEEGFKQSKRKRRNKTSMSFFTALALSFKNMMTKKGRTAMISFAGSIGIVGIALILAVSGGLTGYIDNMQSESLASYPLAISSLAVDYDAAINTMMNGSDNTASSEDGITVYNQQNMLMSMGKYNYLSSDFVSYVDEYYKDNNKMSYLNDIKISYASDMRFIAHNSDANVYTAINNAVVTSAMYGTTNSTFFEGLSNKNYVLSLYNIEGGSSAHYPTGKNEVALVVGDDGRLDVSVLAKMGIGFETNPDGSINQSVMPT